MRDLTGAVESSGYASLLPGFMTAWAGTSPDQGEVMFGTSCNGLVETATSDVGPTPNVHIVPVIGNDLPGSSAISERHQDIPVRARDVRCRGNRNRLQWWRMLHRNSFIASSPRGPLGGPR